MAVSIIIRRTFEDEEKAKTLAPIIVQLRSLAIAQPGYISGQSFRCIDCPGEYLVISTWNTLDDWTRWWTSDERTALQRKVDELLGEETEYRVYEALVGGIIPKFMAPNQ